MLGALAGISIFLVRRSSRARDEAEVVAMFAQAVAAFGTLHIVVSNAGLQRDAAFDQMTMDQWNKVIAVNLTGQFLCAREATREFKRRGLDPKVSLAEWIDSYFNSERARSAAD